MKNKMRWKHLIAALMCATLVLSTPVVYAADEKPSVQTEVKEEKAQDTEQKKEEVKEEVTSANTMQEATDTNTSQVETSVSTDINEITENNRYPSALPQHVIYIGSGDVTFKFDKGAGDYEVKDLKKVQVFFDGLLEIDSSAKDETYFSYNLDKGEFTMKESILKYSQKESLYNLTLVVTLKNNVSYVLSSSTNGNWQYVYIDEESNTDENGFVIKDGVLVKYNGTASEVVIPEGVTSIGEKAFYQNSNITGVTFPSSVKTVQKWAFLGCSKLQMTEIPSSLISIEEGAFSGCDAIKELIIPNSVTNIGRAAFSQNSLTKVTINGNNTTVGYSAFYSAENLKEIILNGSFSKIETDAFGDNNADTVTINGSIKYLGNAFGLSGLKNLIVNGNIESITDADNVLNNIFESSPNIIIHGKTGSYIEKYAKDRNISFEVIEGQPDIPKYEVVLPKENTSLPKSDMQNLVNVNQTQDVVIKSTDGVSFTFPKGSMKMINGKESYDLGVKLITDFSKVSNTPFNKDTFAFRINYNYEGELPGNASISIPVDKKWIGQRLYYYRIMDDGSFAFSTSAVVDANGIYTITQTHCSDYVATTQAPDSNGNPTKPVDSTNNYLKTSPKTGDTSAIWLYLALMMGAGASVVVAKRKSKIK